MICLLQNLTRQLDNIDIVPPVQGLGVEQGPVLLGCSVPEEPGVGVVVLCVPPHPSHGAAVRPGLAVWQVDRPGRRQRPRHLLQREAAGPGRVPGAQLVRRTPRPHTRPPAAHQVTTVRHSPYRPAPRGLGETSGEILPEDTGTEDEDASNAGKGEVDQGLSAIILCEVIEIGLFNELLPVDDENVEDNF